MSLGNKLLAKFEKLGCSEFEVGDAVGRGFADVGYEEFTLVSESKLISQYTGKARTLDADERRFIFRILSVDEMASILQRCSVNIESIELIDGHEWRLRAEWRGREQVVVGPSLLELFLEMMLLLKEKEGVRA